MNCRRAKKLVYDFVDGLCNETEQIELERHLGDCEPCDKLASQLVRSLDMLKRVPLEPVDDNFNWRVRLAIRKELASAREATSSQRGLFRSWNIGYAASAAAGFAVILVAGWVAIGSVSGPASVDSLDNLSKNLNQPVSDTPEASSHRPARLGSRPAVMVGAGSTPLIKSPDAAIGAIDAAGQANRDSLVSEAVKGMTPEERMLYFRERISMLQIQMRLEKHKTRNR